MRIKELTNAPQWLLDAIVRDEDVTIDTNGRVQWHSGDFLGGNFWGGNFRGGDFWGGNFRGGNFLGGDFWGGNFRGGNFLGGNFWGGNFRGGDFWGGNFRGGNFLGGNFWGGNFRGGDFWGGNFLGGNFWGEKIKIKPLCLYGLTWRVIISDTQMEIGCQRHTHDAWFAFTDAQIGRMETRALEFWSAHKIALLEMCAAHAERAAAVAA